MQRLPDCNVEKTITVVAENCPEWVRIPTAFTPNADGLNDLLRPSISGKLASYSIKIFERNGQLIFSSNNPFAGWDGTFKGAAQNEGVYVFLCRYRFHGKPEIMTKGTITLIR